MINSLVDYVLERGNKDYGEFSPRKQIDQNSALFNHRKMLEFLFSNQVKKQKEQQPSFQKRISDMKAEQIAGQLNYFSEKIHAQLNRKYLNIDSDLYRLQNQWLKKKIPAFYCYYFLKFSYANSYSRLHELLLSEIQNMTKEKDTYWIIRKTIEAREICLTNLRKELTQLNDLDIEQSLETIKNENQMKMKILRQQGKQINGYKNSKNKLEQQTGKSWKNKLQLVFEAIEHLRKLSCYVVQLIKNWKSTVYNISEDPRRYRERVIFYHHQANYLLKMLWDFSFIKNSILGKHFQFASHFDPFILKPVMILEAKAKKLEQDDIFLNLVKPADADMDKIVKSLIILAEEEYDEDQQSRFINQKKNFGQLEQRKKYIEMKRQGLTSRKHSYSQKKLTYPAKLISANEVEKAKKNIQFTADKKSNNLPNQIQDVKKQRSQLTSAPKINTSLNRVKNIRSVDLKKISPYLSRNQMLKKAQQVIEFEHKFKVAHNEYLQNIKNNTKNNKTMDSKTKSKLNQLIESNKEISNNQIFNKYIQENVRMLDQANKKAFLYKNHISPTKKNIASSIGYNKLDFKDRKQAEYERNLQRYLPRESNGFSNALGKNSSTISAMKLSKNNFYSDTSQMKKNATRPIIQISQRGIKAGEQIIHFQLSGRKGKNLGSILENQDKLNLSQTVKDKLTETKQKKINDNSENKSEQNLNNSQQINLFETQKSPQIIILRQQPQKLQQLKKSLYEQIKQQLLDELKNSEIKKEDDLNNMVEEEKRRRLQQIIEQRRLEQQRRKEQEQRMRLAQLQKERKKITLPVKIQITQYAQENLDEWFNTKLFPMNKDIFEKLFTNEKVQKVRENIQNELHSIFLKGYLQKDEMAYCSISYDWNEEKHRKMVINYFVTKQVYFYISTFHQICEFLWKNDPVQEIEILMYNNDENQQGKKVVNDIKQYAQRNGDVYQKRLYSNMSEIKMVIYRPQYHNLKNMNFKYNGFYFSKRFNFKAQLLSSAISLSQRNQPQIDMNLQVFTNYIFLLEELFRSYLTPEEIVELRQNSTNIRRLKDIFRIVLQMEKGNPLIDELTVVQGLNLQDLYTKMKDKVSPPYDKYYWNNFYDRTPDNRLLLSILQTKLELPFSLNNGFINDKKMFRINTKGKILVLRSSVYSKQDIYILNTNNPKMRIFLMQGENYKLMRIQLFIFLNLVFNNIVEDNERYISAIWIPQFLINNGDEAEKRVKRITDFSISMKKSFFVSEEIYFCNFEYLKNGFLALPKGSDVIFKESMIFGMLHTEVEKSSTGMPIYAKLIDRNQFF